MSTFSTAQLAIRFEGGTYQDGNGKDISFEAIELKTALVSVSQAKQIIKTQIQGRDGSVKEYIGDDDYNVQIVGTLTGANGVQPLNDLINLKKLLNAPIPLDVSCEYLYSLGIFKLVVESYDLPQDAGGISYQTFTINCISEIPKELRITNV
jgi:Domain of unknown function (DUF6046)